MNGPAPAKNEAERLQALRDYRVLDTAPEQAFDDLTKLASFICKTPVALISLVDEHRQWFKSRVGVEAQETPREIAFCAHAIHGDELFVVPDARQDARFAQNPLVTSDPNICFYAGMPLTTPAGHNIGTLCVVDRKPRELSEEQRAALRTLGRQAIVLLEQHRHLRNLADLAQAKHASEQRLAAQYAIVRVLAESLTLEDALPRILQAVCESLGWEHGAVWQVDAPANLLRCVRTWHIAARRFTEFEELSLNSAFAPGIGLPGRVLQDGRPHWVPDVTHDTNFPRASIAAKEGLHGALAFPILAGGGVFGVMEFFSPEIRQPDEAVLQMLATVGREIGQFVERKRADEAGAHLVAIVESSGDAIASTDIRGIITSWNAGAEQLFGYKPEEVLGKHVQLLLPPGRHDYAEAALEMVRHGGKVLNIEREGIRKDGSRVPVSLTVSPIRNAQGQVIGVSSISRDISERLRWAAELQEAKNAADAANRAKSDFLANMSHEIRTPMNAILGMTELVLDSTLTREQREYLGSVHDAAISLLGLLNDILDFSKIEAGKLILEATSFPLRDLVADSMRVLGLRAHRKGLELACDVQRDVPEYVVGDPTRLRQILVNLVGNAIKFTERGEVVVRVGIESGEDSGVRLHFAVADTGIGIAPEKQQVIFESFVQEDSSTTRRYGGTGLGLTISAQLIAMMEGRIWVESAPGLGSTFHFVARFGRPAADEGQPAMSAAPELHGLRVLVVDDNATNRRILEEMLSHWGMKPVLAGGVQNALKTLHAARRAGTPFSLVITDANMPERDGFDLAAEIRAHKGLAGATVMMITSGGRAGDMARCREMGLAAYLLKPVKQSDLLDAIVTALSGTPWARPGRVEPLSTPAARALRVLVAEDHPVNQELAVRILEKRGHACQVAGNGKEALALLATERFDAVLMDVQMPVMNGLEAAREIRAKENAEGGHVAIIAMTAHAMAGDREQCLAAGMDGYVSKPIDSKKLVTVLESLAGASAIPVESEAPAAPEITFNEAEFRERTGGNGMLARRLARLFLADYPAKLRKLERGISRDDARGVAEAAHALKGTAATLAAHATAATARELEVMGRSNTLEHARQALGRLKENISLFEAALRETVLGRTSRPVPNPPAGKPKRARSRRSGRRR